MIARWVALAAIVLMVPSALDAAPRRRAVPHPWPRTITISDDFRFGPLGWEARFADYSPESSGMDLLSGMRALPPELAISGNGFFISGNNHSDDLFMFLVKKLTRADGVWPDRAYEITFRMTLASQAGSGCNGIGGSPGESVHLKAGGKGVEPRVDLGADRLYRVNFDKGTQANGGTDASLAGDIANGSSNCRSDAPFVTIRREHRHPFPVTAGRSGELWLIVGTDSGYEGTTSLYYQSIEAVLTPLNVPPSAGAAASGPLITRGSR